MPATKLTLSADRALVAEAKRLAAARHTSVSAMFARFLASLAAAEHGNVSEVGPITRKATGMASLPQDRSDEELLDMAIADRYENRA